MNEIRMNQKHLASGIFWFLCSLTGHLVVKPHFVGGEKLESAIMFLVVSLLSSIAAIYGTWRLRRVN